MSSTKNYWHDHINNKNYYKLAKLLGISEEDLDQLNYDIDEHRGNSGDLYGYNIMFYEENDPEIMQKIEGLENGNYVSLDLSEYYSDYEEVVWKMNHSDHLNIFNKQISDVSELITTMTTPPSFTLLVMAHSHVVSSFEYFLSSTFIHHVMKSNNLVSKLIQTDSELKKKKYSLEEIHIKNDGIEGTIAKYLNSIIFHNIERIDPLFKNVLSFEFKDIQWLKKSVNLRHDCAHRAGYNKKGNIINISLASINTLITQCRNLAKDIDEHVRNLEKNS